MPDPSYADIRAAVIAEVVEALCDTGNAIGTGAEFADYIKREVGQKDGES